MQMIVEMPEIAVGELAKLSPIGRVEILSVQGEPGRRRILVRELPAEERRALQGEFTECGRLVRAIWGDSATRIFARARDVHPRSAARWIKGDREPPEEVIQWLREQAAAVEDAYEDARDLAADILDEDAQIDTAALAGAFRRVAQDLDKLAQEELNNSSCGDAMMSDSESR